MAKTVELTIGQGAALLNACFQLPIPSKIEGIGSWNNQCRARVVTNIRQLKKALVAVSPIYKEMKYPKFGPREAYEVQERGIDGQRREREADELGETLKNRYVLRQEWKLRKVEITLNGQAEKGLYEILLLWAHPGPLYNIQSKEFTTMETAGFQEENVWPIAEAMGWRRDLEKKCGCDQADPLEVKTDADYEEEDRLAKTGAEAAKDPNAQKPDGKPHLEAVK